MSVRTKQLNCDDMKFTAGFGCRECKREYSISPVHVCEFCFGPTGTTYECEKIKKNFSSRSIDGRPNL